MLAHASGPRSGSGEGSGPAGKVQAPHVCDVVLSPRGLDVGTVSAHIIKQYLFMRGLLPTQFDELAKFLKQEDNLQETKARRTTNAANKRTQKLLNTLTSTFASLSGLCLQREAVTIVALFGPSVSRPREALEIVFSPLTHQSDRHQGYESFHPQQHLLSAEATRKACCKITRKLVPLLNSLPLLKAAGSTKLFVAVAGHRPNENLHIVHDRYISLKQCRSWSILRVGSTCKASDLQHVKSHLQARVQRQLRPIDDRSIHTHEDEPCLAFSNAAVPSLSYTSDVYV